MVGARIHLHTSRHILMYTYMYVCMFVCQLICKFSESSMTLINLSLLSLTLTAAHVNPDRILEILLPAM